MTNAEKFKSAEEKINGFEEFCFKNNCTNCILSHCKKYTICQFAWLELEYNEELKPCPFCGGEAKDRKGYSLNVAEYYYTECLECSSKTCGYATKSEAIAAWNRRVR